MVCVSGINTVFVNNTAVDFINSPSFNSQITGAGGGSFESDAYFVQAQFQNVEFRDISGTPLFKGILTEVSFKFGPDRVASYTLQDYSFFLKSKLIYGDFEGSVDDVLLNVITMAGRYDLWGAPATGLSGTYKKQFTGQTLLEALQSICQDNQLRYFITPTGELTVRTIASESGLSPQRTITVPYTEVCGLDSDVIENIGYQKKSPDISSTIVFGGENPKFIKNFVPLDKSQTYDIPIESVNAHFKLFDDCIAVRDVIMTITGEPSGEPYYEVFVDPSTKTIVENGCVNYTVTVTPYNGYTGTVNLSLAYPLSPGTTHTFTPTSVTITSGSATSTLQICDTNVSCVEDPEYPGPPCDPETVEFSEVIVCTPSIGGEGAPPCPPPFYSGDVVIETTWTATLFCGGAPVSSYSGSKTKTVAWNPDSGPNPLCGGWNGTDEDITELVNTPYGTFTIFIEVDGCVACN